MKKFILCVLIFLIDTSNCDRVILDVSNSKVELQKCCDNNKLLHFEKKMPCALWSELGIASWSFSPTPDFSSKFHIAKVRYPLCRNFSISPFDNVTLANNGDVIIENNTYDSSRYCIDQAVYKGGERQPSNVLVYCTWKPVKTNGTIKEKHVVSKCCPQHEAYDNTRLNCVRFLRPFFPKVYNSLTGEPLKMTREDYEVIHYNSPCMSNQEQLIDSTEMYIIQTGELYVPGMNRTFPQDRYCLERTLHPDGQSINTIVALVCMKPQKKDWAFKDFCKENICVQKCCPIGRAVYINVGCQDFSEPFIPRFFNDLGKSISPPKHYNITVHSPVCDGGNNPLSFESREKKDRFTILPNGHIYSFDQGISFRPPKYCVDWFFNASFLNMGGFFCPELEMVDNVPSWLYTLYPICMIISSMLLVLTFLVYLFVPELRNLHGRTLMCYVASLLLAYIALIHSQLKADKLTNITCKVIATIMHFAFLSTFFWLNVMCFDIWLTFSSMMTQTGSKVEREKRRFKRYCLYAWGCPLIMSSIMAVMDNAKNIPKAIVRPRIGYQRCWIHGDMAIFVYFYGPIAFLLVLNMVFFGLTAYQLVKVTMETTMIQTTKKNKQRFLLYIKLFLVMGIVWTTEVISWQAGPLEAWYVTDIANTLQGLIIFIIFVCKKKILKKVLKTAKTYYHECPCCKSKANQCATDQKPLRNLNETSSMQPTTSTAAPNSAQIKSHSSSDKTGDLE